MSKREVGQKVEKDLHEQQNVHRTMDFLHDMLKQIVLAAQLRKVQELTVVLQWTWRRCGSRQRRLVRHNVFAGLSDHKVKRHLETFWGCI